MRVGFNPQKDKLLEPDDFFHQVVIPVYIPHQKDYFKDSFTILRYCLESLFKTSHPKTYFCIVNNGSCTEVTSYLTELYDKGKVQELIHSTNIGKLNAVLKGITGHNFSLVTITDADVLFLNDWQKETYSVFDAYPKTGVVSPAPNSRGLRYYTENVIFDFLFSGKLKFTKVKNPDAMIKFASSIGNDSFYNEINLEKVLTISSEKCRAVVGAGHFVATYKGNVFDEITKKYSPYGMGGNSEESLLDRPVIDKGFWRLSTNDNYAFHMGNVMEDWMKETADNLLDNLLEVAPVQFEKNSKDKFVNRFKTRFFSRIIFRKPVWQLFLRFKGLTKQEASEY